MGPFLLCKLGGQRQYRNQQEVDVDTYKIRDGASAPGHGGWFAVAGSALAAASIQWLGIHPGYAARLGNLPPVVLSAALHDRSGR